MRQHHLQAQLLAQHPGNCPAHGVRLPAGGKHQLETGRALRAAQLRVLDLTRADVRQAVLGASSTKSLFEGLMDADYA